MDGRPRAFDLNAQGQSFITGKDKPQAVLIPTAPKGGSNGRQLQLAYPQRY
jgi:hypothetical protein